MIGHVCHAEPDSRTQLTGVEVQLRSPSGLEKGAGSASVCGVSALCLFVSSKKQNRSGWNDPTSCKKKKKK